MSSYIQLYKEVKDILKKIQKKGCFQKYTTKDFFYLMDEKSRGVVLFSEHLYKDGYGIQLFINTPALNYLHDILSTDGNYPINYFYSDCNLLGFIPKKDLMPDDIKFLKDNKIRLSEDYNLMPIRFKEGYGKLFMSKNDLSLSLTYLYYIYALICNERKYLDEAFEKELTPLAIFDNKEMTYSCHYSGLPNLEQMPKNKKVNNDIIEDLKDNLFVDDTCYFFHSYFPEKVTGSDAYKTMILAYYPKSKNYHIDVFDVEPRKIDQYFYGFLDEVFNIYGKPINVLFNNRYLYSLGIKTLSKLNIDVKYSKEHSEYDMMIYELMVENAKNSLNLDSNEENDDFQEFDDNEDTYVS